MRTIRIILLLALGASDVATADTACLRYEPVRVAIEGVVERQTLSGPPGYESVEAGDRAETYWFLKLQAPICVDGPPDELNTREEGVSEVQLNLEAEQYAAFQQLVGQRARATGTLTHAISGNHHTPVLLKVKTLDPVPPPAR
jgi:hypothetical protein